MHPSKLIGSIDEFIDVMSHHYDTLLKEKISLRDRRILMSIGLQLDRGLFITENQSKILIKIIKENIEALKEITPDLETLISNPVWSQSFRKIQRIRKLYKSITDENAMVVEFSYDKRLKHKFFELSSKLDDSIIASGTRHYTISFTEKNILLVVEKLLNEDFEIDHKIMDFYREIEKITKHQEITFEIFSTDNEKFKNIVKTNVADIIEENILPLADKAIRHGYHVFQKIPKNSLISAIAQRSTSKIYINPKEFSFDEVIDALTKLNRFPLLTIFDGHGAAHDRKHLNFLKSAVDTNIPSAEVGVYFRYEKSNDSDQFNSAISEFKYNKNLTETSTIAGISNNKMPKFFIKSAWYPETVISFTNAFKNNKAAVYCDKVDLIIYYCDNCPMNGVEVVSLQINN
jgi:hypothetical protein